MHLGPAVWVIAFLSVKKVICIVYVDNCLIFARGIEDLDSAIKRMADHGFDRFLVGFFNRFQHTKSMFCGRIQTSTGIC